ncbi:unnamed protein product [Thlaspi arvense]|uniref:MATH domain-containing protein n=1 Tax=Thlaspi arvense TaxID=13288 RepID=A0AAU9T756_THLAR|nr:unnamed protein product [Thlaspi arvense]
MLQKQSIVLINIIITSMEKQVEKNFTWVIKYPICLSDNCFSDPFLIAGCKWRLKAFKRENLELLYQYQGVADSQSLPSRWRRYVKLRLTIVNRLSEKLSTVTDSEFNFDEKSPMRMYPTVLPPKLVAKDGGFLVNGEVMIVVEVVAHLVIGTLGQSHGFMFFLHRRWKNDHKSALYICFDSQVESVRRIFEKHPGIAADFRARNQRMRQACMSFMLSLIETLCQSLEELSNEDLVEADIALTYLKEAGFKVDWLEKKLGQLKENKEKEKSGLVRLQEIEESLAKLKLQCSEMDDLAEKEKSELSATRTALSLDHLV